MIEILTNTTMKDYNRDKYWIADDIVPPFTTDTNDIKVALDNYREHVDDNGITISDNAFAHPENMYMDSKTGEPVKVGKVFTGATYIDDTLQYVNCGRR